MTELETGVLILGAGLQGAGVALELAQQGISVTVVEQDEIPFNRASLRNEGKIHLGFIYANDRTRGTAFLQLEGALRFRAILDRWLGPGAEWLVRSTPFHYLVARDSILTPESLAAHYRDVEARCRERLAADSVAGLPRPPRGRALPAADDRRAGFAIRRGPIHSRIRYVRAAIDTQPLAAALRGALTSSPRIALRCAHTARSIERDGGGFRVDGESPNGTWRIRARQVVNASWERRLAFDRQLGLTPPADILHRLKFRVIVRLPPELHGAPSVSMVLGRYGDVVIRFDGTAYLSWYPSGLRGWSRDVEPPREWDAVCRGQVDPAFAREVAASILAGIDDWYPGMARSEPIQVDAGAIVAIGTSDVDDAGSELHDRKRIGVWSQGGYHSVDPGKLTTAPMFAVAAADRVVAFETRRAG